jgi:triosephosphate isomerase (TIM)
MSKKIVVANWKMQPDTSREAEDLYRFISDVCEAKGNKATTIVCPPFVYLESLSQIKSKALLGAQNCHWEYKNRRAFTGEISSMMLKSLGVRYVIIGHSERRWVIGEKEEMINEKLKAVLKNGMTPILAVGEFKKDKDRWKIIENQLKSAVKNISLDNFKKIIIAYEPVWAISTYGNEAATIEDTLKAIRIIRKVLPSGQILYGGSVDSFNIEDFIARSQIDGVMVGKVSMDRIEIQKIIEISSKFNQK